MDHPASPFGDFFPGPGPVAAVNAADLHAMWDLQEDFQARRPGVSFSVSVSSYQRVLGPGADFQAVWYRLSILTLLKQMSKMGAFQLSWLPDGKPSDAVFQAFATVSMRGIPTGKPTNNLPLDLDQLAALIQNQSQSD